MLLLVVLVRSMRLLVASTMLRYKQLIAFARSGVCYCKERQRGCRL